MPLVSKLRSQINRYNSHQACNDSDMLISNLIHQNLSNQNIWNEEFITLNNKIQSCIQNYNSSNVSLNSIDNEINTCINNKYVYINEFIKRYNTPINNFSSLVQGFLNQPCSKKQFDSWIP